MSLISNLSLRKKSDVSIRHLCKFVLICREYARERPSNYLNLMHAAFYDSNHKEICIRKFSNVEIFFFLFLQRISNEIFFILNHVYHARLPRPLVPKVAFRRVFAMLGHLHLLYHIET